VSTTARLKPAGATNIKLIATVIDANIRF
jgi:hypothetical protein